MVQDLAAAYPGLHRLPGQTVLVRADLPPVSDRPVAVIRRGQRPRTAARRLRRPHAERRGRRMTSLLRPVPTPSWPPSSPPLAVASAADRQELHRRPLELRPGRRDGAGGRFPWRWCWSPTTWRWPDRRAGRRGLAGTILVHKIAGAAAEHGRWPRSRPQLGDRPPWCGPWAWRYPVYRSGGGASRIYAGGERDRVGTGHSRRARSAPRTAGAGRCSGRSPARGDPRGSEPRGWNASGADGEQLSRDADDGTGHRRLPQRPLFWKITG